MTRIGFATLTRHFARSILAPPLLTDLGVDFLRRTLASVVAMLLVAGIFVTRALFRKYVYLHAGWNEAAYLRAVEADTLLMIAIPMLIVGMTAIVVSPMLFPDDIDYRTLAHLPISRFEIFAAKFVAVTMVALAAVFAINMVTSLWFPLAVGARLSGQSRWMPYALPALAGAHAVASLAGSTWMFAAVMALQGLCLSVVPATWRRHVAVTLQGAVFVGMLVSLQYVFRIPTMTVSSDDVVRTPLVWVPPVWFLGVDRWLLDPSDEGYASVARIAFISGIIVVALIITTYTWLYRSAERLATDGSVGRVGRWFPLASASARIAKQASYGETPSVPQPTRAILSFAVRGLARSRLHQFVFLLVIGVGLAILTGQVFAVLNGVTFLGYRPRQPLHAIIAAPLLVALAITLALRAVFLLPLDRPACWVFRLTEAPILRSQALDGVATLFTIGAVVPSLVVASTLQPSALGWSWLVAAVHTTLANLLLVEVVLRDWSRLPFTCSYLPGKRVLAYTLGVLLGTYFVFVYIGAHLIRWSLADPIRTIALGFSLLAAFAALRRSRLRVWGKQLLEFEDEDPLALRSLNLLPDERN